MVYSIWDLLEGVSHAITSGIVSSVPLFDKAALCLFLITLILSLQLIVIELQSPNVQLLQKGTQASKWKAEMELHINHNTKRESAAEENTLF